MKTSLSRPAAAAAVVVLLTIAATACSRSEPSSASREQDGEGLPPTAEFLITAGDSTYWVTTGGGRTRVRGAPLTLARYDGRFYEVYVGDDDRSFYDALFVGQRIFRRDLLSGDSAQVYGDRVVAAAARRYAAAHPDEEPLADNEEESENPHLSLTAEVDLVASHGPYLTYEIRTERQVAGELETYDARRGVIDLRGGRRLTVADVIGQRRAPAVLAEGRRRFAVALDSLRAARDDRARRAKRALAHFVFDPTSFGVEDVDRAPAVAFLVPGRGVEAGGYTLPLSPIVVDPAPEWWAELRETLPAASNDSVGVDAAHWARAGAEVEARYDSVRADYAILLRAPRPGAASATTGAWTLGRVHGPARQLYWLDSPPMDSAMRRALARAFDESALYSDEARTAAWRGERPLRRGRAAVAGCPVSGVGCRTARAVSLIGRSAIARHRKVRHASHPTPYTRHRSRAQ